MGVDCPCADADGHLYCIHALTAIVVPVVLPRDVLIPYLVPLVAIAQVWLILFDSDFGAINTLLGAIGIEPIGWLTTGAWAKPTMALLVFWKNSGFAILIMLAAIQNIPLDVYEAAALDGANGFQKFFRITVRY